VADTHSKRHKTSKKKGITYKFKKFVKSNTPYTAWTEWNFTPNIDREEVRGIFVVGIVAALITARSFLSFSLNFVVTTIKVQNLISWLIFGWGAYAVLMALGISEDWVGKTTAKACYALAWLSFVLGLGVTLSLIFVFSTVGFFFFELHTVLPDAVSVALSVLLSVFAFGIVAGFFEAIWGERWPPFLYSTPDRANNHEQVDQSQRSQEQESPVSSTSEKVPKVKK
jgi:hypothetical protein